MKKNKQIKDMSVYEASDFWDEHDFSEFEDIHEVKNTLINEWLREKAKA